MKPGEITVGKRLLRIKSLFSENKSFSFFLVFCCLSAISVLSGILLGSIALILSPLAFLLVILLIHNYAIVFYIQFITLVLSIEYELPNGFGTDMPSEPLMLILMVTTLLIVLKNAHRINSRIVLNGITLALLVHFSWTWITAFFSEDVFVSIKFSLAKTWYIIVFFILSIIFLRKTLRFDKLFGIIAIPLILFTSVIIYRHYLMDFSFDSVNFVVGPFFRNHVNSAAMMSVVVPFVIYLIVFTQSFVYRLFWIIGVFILLLGVYFSYTRAAHIAILSTPFIYLIIEKRLMKYILGLGVVGAIIVVSGWLQNNRYLDFAPDFDTTVTQTSFEDLLSATYQGKDISTMERVYRWVAGYQMIKEKPVMGFGPGNFYNYYKRYAITNFRTYVSDNPEKSGIHSYYLMIAIEQGLVGLIIFLVLCFTALLKLETIYHRLSTTRDRLLIMCLTMSLTIVLLFQLINDLIETDKIGPFFFLILAAIVVFDLQIKGENIILDED